MQSIKVRFNLGAGKNFMKWKIQYPDGKVEYHSPNDVQLLMQGCTLKNHKKVAQKIYEGGEKVVCAWIVCSSIKVITTNIANELDTILFGEQIKYNPRVTPHWMLNGEVVDNLVLTKLVSVGKGVYKL